ncbi:MAG TPA: hypothetical protein VFV98_00275 [Vicinamibacterales bacterium]|nr:hypothetical protein [Vicinamibacterales bacterium]
MRITVAALAGIAVLGGATSLTARQAPTFFSDDPVWREVDTQDASKVARWSIDLASDLVLNLFAKLGDPAVDVRARNINTVDEVPDSSWYTNRAGKTAITPASIAIGPDAGAGPAAGVWSITSAKSDGITPGFTIMDPTGVRWFLKFDPPGYRGMATGTEVAVTKLMWALGYHVPENHIAVLRPEQLALGAAAKITPVGEPERAMRIDDVRQLLKRADREPDGSYRIVASRGLAGRPVGGFRFYDTRPDDPNDVVPHEHRRELRGYGVFAAWLNHVDAKAINSLDTVVTENGHSFVRHYLIDFGSTLGSGGVAPREEWEGFEYMAEPKDIGKGIVSFGAYIKPWRTVEVYRSPAVGTLVRDNRNFNPDLWRARVPNQAFLRARADDKFWAATKLAALNDDLIRAAVKTGEFGNDEAEQFLVKALSERRDAILRAYLPAINPISTPVLSPNGVLTFANAAVAAGVAPAPASYDAVFSTFDNATRDSRRIGDATSATTEIRAPAGLPSATGSYVRVEISATSAAHPSWATPVHGYFKRTASGWTLVGFERLQ